MGNIFPRTERRFEEMKKLVQKFKNFKNDESGMEFLQVAVVVMIVALLIVAVIAIGNAVNGRLNEAVSEVNKHANITLDKIPGN